MRSLIAPKFVPYTRPTFIRELLKRFKEVEPKAGNYKQVLALFCAMASYSLILDRVLERLKVGEAKPITEGESGNLAEFFSLLLSEPQGSVSVDPEEMQAVDKTIRWYYMRNFSKEV